MLYGAPTWVDEILTALAKQVVAKGGFTADRVFESLADDGDHLDNPPADRFVTIRPMSFPAGTPAVTGGGRLLAGFDGVFRLALFCRVSSDQELRDARFLKDQAKGILKQLQAIYTALEQFSPVNGAGDCILRQPLRVNQFDIQPRKVARSGWGVASSTWLAPFTANISATI